MQIRRLVTLALLLIACFASGLTGAVWEWTSGHDSGIFDIRVEL